MFQDRKWVCFIQNPFIFDKITKVRSFDGADHLISSLKDRAWVNRLLLQYYAEFLFCRFFYKCLLGGGCLFHSRQIDLIEGHSPKQLSPSLPFERYLKQYIAKFKQRWIGRHKNRCRSHLLRGEDFPICSSGEKEPAWLHIPSMHWRSGERTCRVLPPRILWALFQMLYFNLTLHRNVI